jgi:hypothetical protein
MHQSNSASSALLQLLADLERSNLPQRDFRSGQGGLRPAGQA